MYRSTVLLLCILASCVLASPVFSFANSFEKMTGHNKRGQCNKYTCATSGQECEYNADTQTVPLYLATTDVAFFVFLFENLL